MRMFFTMRTGMTLDGAPVKDPKPPKRKTDLPTPAEINKRNREFWDLWAKQPITEPEGNES